MPSPELTVDVILPTHAGERWVAEAIESVLRQTHPLWRLIVVDDCSPDATAERVESLRLRDPGRIALLRLDRPRRAAGARMAGIAHGSGDVIAFLDQDDRWLPEKLARQVACLAADPALAAVHTDVEIIDADGQPLVGAADRENARRAGIAWGTGPDLSAVLFERNSIRLASSAVRRSAFEAIGGFDSSLFGGEDWEFWVRLADRFSVAHLPEVLTQRRIHPGNSSRVHSLERSAGKLRALEKMERDHRQVAPLAAAKREQLLREAASAAVRQRRPGLASRYALRLLARRLRSLFAPPSRRRRAGAPGRVGGGKAGTGDPARAPLRVCERLFERLNRDGIRYCHWKSNEHLPAALAGQTDLDLLLAPHDRDRFEQLLAGLDFKRICSPPEKRYPGVEDYLGFDAESGGLAHLHVHYALILGQPHVKNHRLPLESALLRDVRMLHGVRVPSAELEMLLLVVRANAKLPLLRLLRRWRRPGIHLIPSAVVREFQFLAGDWDEGRFASVVESSGLPLPEGPLRAFVAGVLDRSITPREVYRTRAAVFRALRGYRRSHPAAAALRGLRGRLFRSRLGKRLLPRKKTLPGRGPVVALVGADGAGKTALSNELRDWLSWKLLAPRVYFGIPKRAWVYRALRRAAGRLRSRAPRLAARLRAEQWLFVARRRLAEHRRARRLAARGAVVVADRYPLDAFRSMEAPMDGPRIRRELGAAAARSAGREEALYDRIGPPSRVFVLRAGLACLAGRKPGLDPVSHGRKVDAVNAIGPSELFSLVDAERRYEDVLLDLKRRIWSLL